MSSAPCIASTPKRFYPTQAFIDSFRFYNGETEVNDVELFYVFVCLDEFMDDYHNWGWLDDSAGIAQLKEACLSAKLYNAEMAYHQVQALAERYGVRGTTFMVIAQKTFARMIVDHAVVSNETNPQLENMRTHLVQKKIVTQEQAGDLKNMDILRYVYRSLSYSEKKIEELLTLRATWKKWPEFERICLAIQRRARRNQLNVTKKMYTPK